MNRSVVVCSLAATLTLGSVGCRSTQESVPSRSSAAASPAAPPSCAPWNGASKLEAHSVAGRADFFREFKVEIASGTLEVHDSDPFASGAEQKVPRVIRKTVTLTPADRASLLADLSKICPDGKALASKCAPGGCLRLVVDATTIEDMNTVRSVMKLLETHFPELRQ
jgi:hypothetical protein